MKTVAWLSLILGLYSAASFGQDAASDAPSADTERFTTEKFLILCSPKAILDKVGAPAGDLREVVDLLMRASCHSSVRGFLAGYETGVLDAAERVEKKAKSNETDPPNERLNDISFERYADICIPDGLDNFRAVELLIKYINDNPKSLPDDPNVTMYKAFRTNFPCAAK